MSLADDLNKLNFNNIGNWPVPFKLGAMTLLLTLILGGGYWFIWADQLEGLDRAQQEEKKLRKEFIEKKTQAVNLDLYQQQVKDIEQAFGALVRQLPNRAEMDALLTDIAQAGIGRGLEMDLFKPAPNDTPKDFYAELPITLRLTGNYHDMGRFASDIAQLPRIVTLNNISISPAQAKDSGALTLNVVAMTYRYLDEEEIANMRKAAKGKEKGGKK